MVRAVILLARSKSGSGVLGYACVIRRKWKRIVVIDDYNVCSYSMAHNPMTKAFCPRYGVSVKAIWMMSSPISPRATMVVPRSVAGAQLETSLSLAPRGGPGVDSAVFTFVATSP